MASQLSWLQTVSKQPLPILTSNNALPGANAPYKQWTQCIEQDPVLALHLFHYTNKILTKNQTQASSLSHVISLLGTQKIYKIAANLPRVDKRDPRHLSLFQLVADAQVATLLLKQCLHHKHLQMQESEYWQCIFHYVGHWPLILLNYKQWQKQDAQLEDLKAFNHRSSGITRIDANRWQQSIAKHFLLPRSQSSQLVSLSPIEPLTFKQQHIDVLMPYCHLLAFFSRKDSVFLQQNPCYRWLEKQLGISYFSGFLKTQLAQAAREIKNPYAGNAIKQLFKYPRKQKEINTQQSAGLIIADSVYFKRLYIKILKQPRNEMTKRQLIRDCLQGCCLGLGMRQATFFTIQQQQLVCVEDQQGSNNQQRQFSCSIHACSALMQLTQHSHQLLVQTLNNQQTRPELPADFLTQFTSQHFLLLSICQPGQCLGIFYFDLTQSPLNTVKKKQAFEQFVQKISEKLISL